MKMLDLFSGFCGFHLGFEFADWEFDWIGHSDTDKYANSVYEYNFKHKKKLNVENLGNVRTLQPENLPKDITILCGGFPCQSFSIAGKRDKNDPRGTLFFEIIRILRYFREIGKPIPYILLENVKGLLSHDDGHTFATILRLLSELDYSIESQILNTRIVLPQNRQRIFICGIAKDRLGEKCRGEIFPLGEDGDSFNGEGKVDSECSSTLTARYWKMGDMDTYIDESNVKGADYRNDEGLRIRPNGLSPTLATSRSGENHLSRMIGLVVEEELNESQSGKVYNTNGIAPTLNSEGGGMGAKTGLYKTKTSIRRLPPNETERLQGFSWKNSDGIWKDGWTKKGIMDGKIVDISDTQRYRQMGNAVSVPIIQMVAEQILKFHKENNG